MAPPTTPGGNKKVRLHPDWCFWSKDKNKSVMAQPKQQTINRNHSKRFIGNAAQTRI